MIVEPIDVERGAEMNTENSMVASHVTLRAISLAPLLCLAVSLLVLPVVAQAAEEVDPLQAIYAPVVKPFAVQVYNRCKNEQRYPEEAFPLSPDAFAKFRADIVSRMEQTLKLEDWSVRAPLDKRNRLQGKFRDRLLKTIEHHGIRMEVHLIELLDAGIGVPAVICLPPGEKRRPGVCVFSGHTVSGLRQLVIDLDGYQRGLATRMAQAGFVTIAVEKIDSGYLSKTFPKGADEPEIAPHLLHWGLTTRSHQLMACLAASEMLATHPRVDETRMGAAGVSLGGWLSMQTAMLNDRISVVADFGMKGLHVDPDISALDFKGEFQRGGSSDWCHILPGMLSLCDRNVLALACAPKHLIAGHGRRDKISSRQAPVHYRQLFEKQFNALGREGDFRYHVHNGGDVMPDAVVIDHFRRVLASRDDKTEASIDTKSDSAVSTKPKQQTAGTTVRLSRSQGEMAGEATPASIILQSRLTQTDAPVEPNPSDDDVDDPFALVSADVAGAEGVARFEIADNDRFEHSKTTEWLRSVAANDYIVKTKVSGLSPGTRHYYRLQYGSNESDVVLGETCSFQTLWGKEHDAAARFVVVTGMNYEFFHKGRDGQGKQAYKGSDKHLGYPALETILNMKPDFFVGTGDNVYYDTYGLKRPRARSLAELRRKWHLQFSQPRYRDLFGRVPTYWEKDDHDHRYNDCDRTTDREPTSPLGIDTFREQVPVVDPDDSAAVTYRTHRVSGSLQLWFVEGRDYRSANNSADGPNKTLWGAAQKQWLKKTLVESDAAFKILISPTPLVGPDDLTKRDNHADVKGFRQEGDEFFDWLVANGFREQNFYIVCGDRHWQYRSIHPSGIEEFSCGALVDANSRLGVKPGDRRSSDPQGLIKQPYTQAVPSGGFLSVEVNPASGDERPTIAFKFFDERGAKLYEHVETSRGERR